MFNLLLRTIRGCPQSGRSLACRANIPLASSSGLKSGDDEARETGGAVEAVDLRMRPVGSKIDHEVRALWRRQPVVIFYRVSGWLGLYVDVERAVCVEVQRIGLVVVADRVPALGREDVVSPGGVDCEGPEPVNRRQLTAREMVFYLSPISYSSSVYIPIAHCHFQWTWRTAI